MTMAFITLQTGFYLGNKLSDADLLGRVVDGIERIDNGRFRFVGLEKYTSRILRNNDVETLNKRGNLLMLKETNAYSFLHNGSLAHHIYLITSYPDITFVKLDPILGAFDKERIDQIYALHREVVESMIPALDPDLVQTNGLGDEEHDIVHPTSWDYRSAPPFFSPYNYLRQGLIPDDRLALLAEMATVRPHHDGYVIEFVESITQRPTPESVRRLKEWYRPHDSIGYAQVAPKAAD